MLPGTALPSAAAKGSPLRQHLHCLSRRHGGPERPLQQVQEQQGSSWATKILAPLSEGKTLAPLSEVRKTEGSL